MPHKPTRSTRLALAGLLWPLLLTSCGNDARPAIVKPAPQRYEKPAYPAIPTPAAPCSYDAARLCLTDEQTGKLIADYDAVLTEAFDKLDWLRDWFTALP